MLSSTVDEGAGRRAQSLGWLGWLAPVLVVACQVQASQMEHVAEVQSLDRAARAMDAAADRWGESRRCVTCHTNGLALLAQAEGPSEPEAVERNRAFARSYLSRYLVEGQEPRGQQGSVTGLVATSAFLALSDARGAEEIGAMTRLGLDYAWSALDDSGTWEGWLQCNWPPYEADTAFGTTLMLVALGELRERFGLGALSASDLEGATALQGWLRAHAPVSPHDEAMRIWAGTFWGGVEEAGRLQRWRADLGERQRVDGGWSMASLGAGTWVHDGGLPLEEESGAYATAFSLFILLETGADPGDERIRRGRAWLRRRQGADGMWTDRSPRRDGLHYIGRAATAFAILALADDQ